MSAGEFKPCYSYLLKTLMTKKIRLIGAILFILMFASAHADDASRNKEIQERFAKCDINHDGKLTRNEAKGCMPRIYDHFGRIDEQNKGFVTVLEIERMADK
jgi:Ca2+-binding EF-hand superfamily protein